MPLTAIQRLACEAEKIACKIPNRELQMAALIYLINQLPGNMMTCAQIVAGAESIANCGLDRSQQLPALIYLVNNSSIGPQGPAGPTGPQGPAGPQGPGGSGGVFSGNYGGGQPPFTPTVAAAFAIDTSNGEVWEWWNSQWH